MVRDLIGTVKKEGAAIGLLITISEPTRGMMNLAVHSEPYKSDLWLKDFPSIQIRTVGELLQGKNPNAVALGRLGGLKGGKARAKKLSSEQRTEIARKAARIRWSK